MGMKLGGILAGVVSVNHDERGDLDVRKIEAFDCGYVFPFRTLSLGERKCKRNGQHYEKD